MTDKELLQMLARVTRDRKTMWNGIGEHFSTVVEDFYVYLTTYEGYTVSSEDEPDAPPVERTYYALEIWMLGEGPACNPEEGTSWGDKLMMIHGSSPNNDWDELWEAAQTNRAYVQHHGYDKFLLDLKRMDQDGYC